MAAKVDQNTDVSPSKPSADEQKIKTLGQIMANIAKDAPQ